LQAEHIERKVCFNLCCARGGQTPTISLTWERESFLGDIEDSFQKKNGYEPLQPQLNAFGNATQALQNQRLI